ncbi:hypothetical protein [Pseudomonas putida]
MKKIVPDPPLSSLSQLDPPAVKFLNPPSPDQCDALMRDFNTTIEQTIKVMLDSGPGLTQDAMGVNVRVLCQMLNALCVVRAPSPNRPNPGEQQ